MTGNASPLPFEERRAEDVPGHWLLARVGKRVLRPGGAALTRSLLDRAGLPDADVVELAPGLGWTAREVLAAGPRSYTGVDKDPDAARLVGEVVAGRGRCLTGDAAETGLPAGSADVVVAEAMLSMQSERGKRAIVAEAVRLLRPGGRYAIHELGLRDLPAAPSTAAPAPADEDRKDLARSIKVNARPLPISEWRALLTEAGLVVDWVGTAPMQLLGLRRNLADEGVLGTARIVRNVLRDREVRERVLAMRATFRRQRGSLVGVALVAHLPTTDTAADPGTGPTRTTQEDPR